MSLLKAIEIVSGINEFGNLFQLVKSAVSYLRSWNNGLQEQEIKEHEVLQLQSDLRGLSETLPSMYNLLDRAEWRSHEKYVAELIPKLNDAVYDAEDLLDEFSWYEIKVSIEGNSTQLSSLIEFFRSVTQGSFNKVTDIQKRLSYLSSQLEKMGLHEATPRFDKSVRPVTTSFRTEAKIFGRENEIEEVVRLLGVPNNSSRSSSKRKRICDAANNEPRAADVPVLPIVGMGGVGKTTLAQEITTLGRVKSHFDEIIWICVSDEFDAERFTKVLIKSLSGKEAMADNFDDLQRHLAREVGKKRFLLILDDIWPDSLKEDGRNWRKFCAPLTNVLKGSMLLVTTRFAEVANTVGTMESFALNGLEPGVFWDLFKLCVFGSKKNHIDPQLEVIGRSILPKLKGSPLAAMTIGRLLRKSLTTKHWNDILNSELWQLRQEETDILPALRLSYMYLPFHLKRCFSFCAVYPKDYNFRNDSLAEIWVAEGFVEPQGNIPLQHIGGQYFEDLVNLSFFQKLRGKYVIHDLMHDMAQLVSKDECFIVKDASDIEKVPQNVRHLSILKSGDLNCDNLASLHKHKKLRTLLCKKSLYSQSLAPVTYRWVSELQCLRAISLASARELPENISNLKHLRYLEISEACPLLRLPSTFCCLYNLQILYAKKCVFERLPIGFSNLIYLKKFEARVEAQPMSVDALEWEKIVWSIKNSTIEDLTVYNLGAISKDHAAKMGIMEMERLNCLSLRWSSLRSQEHNEIEVLEALHPHRFLKSMHLKCYPGEYLPWGFHPCNLPTLTSPSSQGSDRPEENLNQNEASVVTVGSSNGRTGSIFPSLTELNIEGSEQLSSLEQFLQPDCAPAIKKIVVENCQRLSAKFRGLCCLEELMVYDCPNIISQGVFAPYLKKLTLEESINSVAKKMEESRNLGGNLTSLLNLEMWSLPALLELTIIGFNSLSFIGKANLFHHSGSNSSTRTLSSLNGLTIQSCSNMKNIEVLLSHCVSYCAELQCLPGERLGSFSSLRDLEILDCPRLNWQSGMVLPSSLQRLSIRRCGDISSWFPGCVENLASLQSLEIEGCERIVSIPGHLWRNNLPSLKKLEIIRCPDLVSIGGPNAIAHIVNQSINSCAKLEEIVQPN